MDGHSVLFQTLSEISTMPPEKPQKVTILHRNTLLVKHRLYISHYSHWVLSETKQYSNQVVGQIRTLQQFAIQRHPLELSGTIEDDRYLLRFLAVIHPMVWNIPDLSVSSAQIFRWNLLSETFLDYALKRCNIVFLKSGILEEFTSQGEGSALGLASIRRQRQTWITTG